MTFRQFFFKYINKCKRWFIAYTLIACLPPALDILSQKFYAQIIASIGTVPSLALSSPVLINLLIVAILYIAQDVISGLNTYFEMRTKISYQRVIHNELLAHTHKHSANFFNTEQSGVILAKTNNLIQSVFSLMGDIRIRLLPNIAFLIFSTLMLLTVNIWLAFIIITINILSTFLLYYNSQKIKSYASIAAKEESKVTGLMVDSIANARLVKFSAAVKHELMVLIKQIHKTIRAFIKQAKVQGYVNFSNTILFVTMITFILIAVSCFFYYDKLSLADIILCATISARLADHSFELSFFFNEMHSKLGTANDALRLLYQPFDITDAPKAKTLKIKENSVEFKNATFAYKNNKPLFNKLNLLIKPNEKLGLVGVSGSGKSTLINLILRGFDLNKGKILISNQDITKVTQYSLHQNIALISQEPCLFNRSIMENIRFAKPKASDDEVIKAAKLAHIHDTIIKMPKGYNSVVGEKGVKLSGGERQRIAIAAAILKDTPILILDEATSALDSQSEQAIEKALKELMKNKTVIAIAHRLSTLKNMDKIAVLDKGNIIEYGSQKDLLKNKSGTFYKLYKLQSDGYLQN